jgi:ParB-like chromosome segregation protein Spo0J
MFRRDFLQLSIASMFLPRFLRREKPKLVKGKISQIKVSDLIIDHSLNVRARPLQPDDELVKSIKERGMIAPIVITDTYKLAAGFRRVEAAKILGLRTIPAWCCGEAEDYLIIQINLAQNCYRRLAKSNQFSDS